MNALKFNEIPLADMPKDFFFNGGCVYIACIGGICKVGCSTNPYQRISRLQAGAGLEFQKIYLSSNVAGHHGIEKKIHALIKQFNLCGEWYKVKPEVIINRAATLNIAGLKSETTYKRLMEIKE